MNTVASGFVTRYYPAPDKQYGFVDVDGQKVFFHGSRICSYKNNGGNEPALVYSDIPLLPGQTVNVCFEEGPKGPRANWVAAARVRQRTVLF
jgi:cold shock CspA family protein